MTSSARFGFAIGAAIVFVLAPAIAQKSEPPAAFASAVLAHTPPGWSVVNVDPGRQFRFTSPLSNAAFTLTWLDQDNSACPPEPITMAGPALWAPFRGDYTLPVSDFRACSSTRLGIVKSFVRQDAMASSERQTIGLWLASFFTDPAIRQETRPPPIEPRNRAFDPDVHGAVAHPERLFAKVDLIGTYTHYQGTAGNGVDATGARGNVSVAFSPSTFTGGYALGAATSLGGERVAYDFHMGPWLGTAGSAGALYLAGGGGTDSANLGLRAAWYAYVEAGLDLELARAFRIEAVARQAWRTKDSYTQQLQSGIVFACIGGSYPCWQFTTGLLLSSFPEIDVHGVGFFFGARFFDRPD